MIGLDPSLTGTGLADRFGSTVHRPKLGTDYYARAARLENILAFVLEHVKMVRQYEPRAIVMIEGYSFNSKVRGEQLGELGGVLRHGLWSNDVPYVEVPPARLKKFVTGKGNADKDLMLTTTIRRWEEFEGSNNNEADAFALRQMGLARYTTRSGIPQYSADVLNDIEWPEGI